MEVKVSVLVVFYNHENFIRKCLDSILAQKTTFEFDIVIGDDNSVDSTKEIIFEYKKKYGRKIKEKINKVNVGATRNIFETIDRCTGKYIAIMGGDDYWIDNNKLQKQFNALEENNELALHYTNCYQFLDGNEKDLSDAITFYPDNIFDLNYYFENNCFTMNSQTAFFRKDALPSSWEDWMYDSINQDWLLLLLILEKGNACFLNEYTGMYRLHPKSLTHSMNRANYNINGLKVQRNLNKYFDFKFDSVLGSNGWLIQRICLDLLFEKKYLLGLKYALLSVFKMGFKLTFIKTIYLIIFRGYKPKY